MTAYDLAYTVGLGAAAPVWLLSPRLRRKVLEALRSRTGAAPSAEVARFGVLIHAVSVGEINATTALVKGLGSALPDLRFTVTTTSLTGAERSRELYESNAAVTRVRFPLDFSRSIRRLLDAQKPSVVVLMELEVWPNFMKECARRGIPVVLVNGRLSAYSFGRYRAARLLIRPMFRRLSCVCAQEQAYAYRFAELGVPPDRIAVTGTMKFDTAQGIDGVEGVESLADAIGLHSRRELGDDAGSSPNAVWVCGSTGPGEEVIVLSVHRRLLNTFPKLRLIIVPRHPQRFDEAAELIEGAGFGSVRRSKGPVAALTASQPSQAIVLGDTMGELRKFYSLADVVFVGRTLVDMGSKQHGSDMIEPAALGKPVVVGPFTGNFAEVMNRFREADAMREVQTAEELQTAVAHLLSDATAASSMGRRARAVVRENLGATARHIDVILRFLPGQGRDEPVRSRPVSAAVDASP